MGQRAPNQKIIKFTKTWMGNGAPNQNIPKISSKMDGQLGTKPKISKL